MPRLTQRSVTLKLLLLRKQGDKWGEDSLSRHSLALSLQSHSSLSWPQWGKSLTRHSPAVGYGIILLPACLSSRGELECPNTWRYLTLSDGLPKPWREQRKELSLQSPISLPILWRSTPKPHCPSWGHAVTAANILQETKQKPRTVKFGFICLLDPFRKLVSGWSNSGTEHRGIKQYLGIQNIHNSIPPSLH